MVGTNSSQLRRLTSEIIEAKRVVSPDELLLVMKYSDDHLESNRALLSVSLASIGFRMGEQYPVTVESTLEWCRGVLDCLSAEERWGMQNALTKTTRANLFHLSLNLLNRWFTSDNANLLLELISRYFP